MSPLPISVVVITKNEELMIGRCLSSLADFSEVYIVDSNSDDRTQEIARGLGAQVVPFTWNGAYPKKKQWALENISFSNEWVLYLDGDEYLSQEFVDALPEALSRAEQRGISAYDVRLEYHFLGRRLRRGHQVKKRILFKRARCEWLPLNDLGVVNPFEMELHVQPTVAGEIDVFPAPIVHKDEEDLNHYFDRHNRYSDWEAELRLRGGGTASAERTAQGNLWSRTPLKPLVFFAYSYVARLGLLDGRPGLYYALAQCLYYAQIDMKTFDGKRRRSIKTGEKHV